MKKVFCLCLVVALCVFSSSVFAGGGVDTDGYFDIGDVTVNGVIWDSSNIPEITMGETYNVDMDVSYDADDSLGFQHTYDPDVYAEIQLPWMLGFGPVVWTASDNNPTENLSQDGTYVDTASWSLSGDLVVPVNQLYLGHRFAKLYLNTVDGNNLTEVDVECRIADVNAAPVPEPATILLLGIGLLGIVGFSRRKKKA